MPFARADYRTGIASYKKEIVMNVIAIVCASEGSETAHIVILLILL